VAESATHSRRHALVVYESMYGNTKAIAEAVAEGLSDWDVSVRSVHEEGIGLDGVELLVVGGPTHMHGLSSSMSRKQAAQAGDEDGHAGVQPSATQGPGLRRWLRDLSDRKGVSAAAFDTRLDRSAALTGSAARGIARRLRGHGYEIVGTQSFLVEDAEGPLEHGELERARTWGATLAGAVPASA
jgi:Flavodoxin domain